MSKYRKLPWKKGFRIVPDVILKKVENTGQQRGRVGCVKKIARSAVVSGLYSHLGIRLEAGDLRFPESILPPANVGPASSLNRSGYVIIHKDRPKVDKDFFLGPRPIYGDWSNGSFDLWVTKKVFQRTEVPPAKVKVRMRLLGTEQSDDPQFVVYFSVDRALEPTSPDFDGHLLDDINLLQENTGAIDYVLAEPTEESLLGLVYVNWELLPPGTRDATLASILSRAGNLNDAEHGLLYERYDLLEELEPISWIVGTGQFVRYFGGVFNDKVVLENLRYGNAAYVMPLDQWEELSKQSRLQLIDEKNPVVRRIAHRPGWQKTLSEIVKLGDE